MIITCGVVVPPAIERRPELTKKPAA
jgi:hypothetical protein